MVELELLLLAYDEDPVASRLTEHWGTPAATGLRLDDSPIRALAPGVGYVRRPGRHIFDEGVDRRLPEVLRTTKPTLVFPSIHRSEQQIECLSAHPLGNPGPDAEVGGRARTLVPTDPRRMADALRRLDEGGRSLGLRATYEATHHGPEVALPAFFVEIGYGTAPAPSPESVALLARVLPEIRPDPEDRVALGVGGGHYAPHFTDLALRRRWAFGHLLSRHAFGALERATVEAAFALSPGAEGIVFARAEDARNPIFDGIAPRRRDQDAPRRGAPPTTSASPPASGT